MTERQFRKEVKRKYPHMTVRIRTVGFQDLARASAKCLEVEGDRTAEELADVNRMGKEAGILPDSNCRIREVGIC